MLQPVILNGNKVRLEPLTVEHLDAMCVHGLDADLWQWIPNQVRSREDMADYIDTALAEQARGASLPFVIISTDDDTLVGCTRYGNISEENRRLEIGWTWVTKPWQRTVINTEAKYLLLKHAFESLGMQRVELKTDALNERSRNAIARIGAKQEGVFRRHWITDTGRVRDTVYFSIIEEEWPEAKARLEQRLQDHVHA